MFKKPTCLSFGYVLVVMAGMLPLATSAGTDRPEPNRDPCYLFTGDAEYFEFDLRLHLRDDKIVPFRVPIDYIEDNKMYPNGGELTAKSFQVGMEAFEPVSRFEAHNRNKSGIWDWMPFIVKSLLPLEEITLIYAHNASGERRESIDDYQLLAADFGLFQLDHPVRVRSNETYIVKSLDGQISDVVRCSQEGQVPYPSCFHTFEYQDITVAFTYRRTETPNWRDMRLKLERFLSCAISN